MGRELYEIVPGIELRPGDMIRTRPTDDPDGEVGEQVADVYRLRPDLKVFRRVDHLETENEYLRKESSRLAAAYAVEQAAKVLRQRRIRHQRQELRRLNKKIVEYSDYLYRKADEANLTRRALNETTQELRELRESAINIELDKGYVSINSDKLLLKWERILKTVVGILEDEDCFSAAADAAVLVPPGTKPYQYTKKETKT